MKQKCNIRIHYKINVVVYRRIPPLTIPCTWKDLKENIKILKITSPGSEALTSHKGSLTYITGGKTIVLMAVNVYNEGQFAVFIEMNKDSDLKRNIYDPLICDFKMYSEEEMKKFVWYDLYKLYY